MWRAVEVDSRLILNMWSHEALARQPFGAVGSMVTIVMIVNETLLVG